MRSQQLSSLAISMLVHAVMLFSMFLVKTAVQSNNPPLAIETVLADEDRTVEEVQQELDKQEVVAEEMNFTPGGLVSTNVGGASSGVGGGGGVLAQQTKIDSESIVKDPQVKVNVGSDNVPGLEIIGNDLGGGEVTGEVGAVVDGYGPALDRLTQELIRMMRNDKILAVWMFDESESMKDDQQELKTRIHRVYEELKLVEKDPEIVGDVKDRKKAKEKTADILLTAITSFGEGFKIHTPRPTNDQGQIMAAIDKIPIDKTGKENTMAAMDKVFKEYGKMGRGGGRKLVVICVSDESGDDGQHVEEVRHQAISLRSPIYVLGRESVFGSLYGHVKWVQPTTGILFYLPIRRGPETPYAEQLQWDGFRRRRDAQMSGFGPYEQVRLCRDTGGIFFQLPNEEADINDLDKRKFESLDIREYLPNLDSRRDYEQERDRSPFRKAIWDVVLMLNPYDPGFRNMEIPDHEYFSINWNESSAAVTARLQQIANMITALAGAQQHLEKVKGLRSKESSSRWRANYDLVYAQIFAYRIRLYEYALALGQFGKTMPQRIKNPKTNRWSIAAYSRELIYPDADQEKALRITKKDVNEANEMASKLLRAVIEDHPRTAYARRAEYELSRPFGAHFNEHYFAPPGPPPNPAPPPPPPPPNL